MAHLFLFNPGHEMEMLCGASHYTPPYTVQCMVNDLEMLPIWYGGGGNFVLVHNIKASDFMSSLPSEFRRSFSSPMILSLMMKDLFKRKKTGEKPRLPQLKGVAWGVSQRSSSTFMELKEAGLDLSVTEWKSEYINLTSRQTSAQCLKKLQERFQITPAVAVPRFFEDIESIKRFVSSDTIPYIIKTPFSSSGRGLYWLDDNNIDKRAEAWIGSALRKQDMVSVEPALDNVFDFASEFYSDGKGEVKYVGLSIFKTHSKGRFDGCMLGSQTRLQSLLNEYILQDDYNVLVEQIRTILQEEISHSYEGYMGVDMFIYNTKEGKYAVHPFVELNLRYTMGLAAMQISRQFIHPDAQGIFKIKYHVYDAIKEHIRMTNECPLVIEEGKIRSGYMSLCPVEATTHYMATIEIKQNTGKHI